jgi:hypothetical protein
MLIVIVDHPVDHTMHQYSSTDAHVWRIGKCNNSDLFWLAFAPVSGLRGPLFGGKSLPTGPAVVGGVSMCLVADSQTWSADCSNLLEPQITARGDSHARDASGL